MANLAEGAEAPLAPVAPAPPADPPAVVPFQFPDVVKGFLYLRHVGITLQTRASLLRSAGGSLRYSKVAELLRRTELDAMVASRNSQPTDVSYLADAYDEDLDIEEEDEDYTDEDYDEEFGGFVESGESEGEPESADGEVAEGDYDAAMLGYLEARKRLMSLRKSRGFKDPGENSTSSKPQGSAGRDHPSKDNRSRPSSSNRPSSQHRRRDFQWREGNRAPSRGRGRPKTPPPHRRFGSAGKGKTKGSSRKGGQRKDPPGSQFLGMAVTLRERPPIAFQPEFSFMAIHNAQTTEEAENVPTLQHALVSRAVPHSVEGLVERCLLLDNLLGLAPEVSDADQSCCLATPPGHAILDTGCTSTLVGAENEVAWREELQRRTGGSLKVEKGPSDIRFEGINGESQSSYTVRYPVRIGNRDGYVDASVIPGRAPFLLSIKALRQMRAKLDCERDTLEIPGIGKVGLKVNQVGHYLLPLLDFPDGHVFMTSASSSSAEAGLASRPEGDIDDGRPGLGEPSTPEMLKGHPPVLPVSPPSCELPTEELCSEVPTAAVPEGSSVVRRTESTARKALLRLAKETKGPWVALPKELPALFLIMGPHAYEAAVENGRPWQVRAAQIGYKCKIVRRPPPSLKDSWVTVLALVDTPKGLVLRTLVEWTETASCAGKPLPSAANMFLFVFAFRPDSREVPPVANMNMSARIPQGPRDVRTVFYLKNGTQKEMYQFQAKHFMLPPKGSGIRLSDVVRRQTVCASSGDILESYSFDSAFLASPPGLGTPPAVQGALMGEHTVCVPEVHACSSQAGESDLEEFYDCNGPEISVSMLARRRRGEAASACSCRIAYDRKIRQRARRHVALCRVSPEVPRVQRPDCSADGLDRQDHLCPASRLRGHQDSRSIDSRQPHGGRHGPDGRRGLLPDAPVLHRELPVRREEGDLPGGPSSGNTAYFDIGSDCGSTSGHGDQGSDYDEQFCPAAACDPSRGAAPGELLSGAAGSTEDHGIRQGDAGPGVCGHAGCGCEDAGAEQAHPRASPRARVRGHRPVDQGGTPPAVDRHGGRSCAAACSAAGSHARAHAADGAARFGSSYGKQLQPPPVLEPRLQRPAVPEHGHRARQRRPGFWGWLGACAFAMIETGSHLPPAMVSKVVPEDEVVDEASVSWPRVSPEFELSYVAESDLTLPLAWRKLDMSRLATKAQLRTWLGPQGYKIDSRVGLVELFAGKGRLSDAYEEQNSSAIRLGRAWGQELRGDEAHWLVRSLIIRCKPRDVFVAFPCRAYCQWSNYNLARGLATRQKILRDRLESRGDLDLLFEVMQLQSDGGRYFHAENPQGSKAWKDRRFKQLKCRHYYVTFHQCRLNLKHPKTGKPLRKATTIITNNGNLAVSLARYKCRCGRGSHDQISGSFQGRSVSSWAEDYPLKMCRAIVVGFQLPGFVGFGETLDEPVHCSVQQGELPHACSPCYLTVDGDIEYTYPAEAESQTIFKITDTDIVNQLSRLQYPGRYKSEQLPVPVQTQLHRWCGLELDTLVTSRHVKCFVLPPKGVVATCRTTICKVSGEWFYVEFATQLQGLKRLRLPVNCTLVVTFFGDKPSDGPPPPAEVQPKQQSVPGTQNLRDQRQVSDYLARLHVGLGHCGQAEFIQHLRDAGAATWLIRQAERFECAICNAHRPPPSHSVIGSAKPRSFNHVLSIDTLDLTLTRDNVLYRVFLLTAIDSATSYARVFQLASGDAESAVQQLQRGWIEAYGAPDIIYCDPDSIFRSEVFAAFLARNSVLQRLSAAQSPHQHGQVERLHRTLRLQAQKVFESERTCSVYDASVHVIQARNELMRVEGVSPAVLVFGKLPRAPPGFSEGSDDYELLAERLHNEDPLYEVFMRRRLAARTAWVQAEVRDRTARAGNTRPRPYRGPYVKGQVVLVYRRKRGDAANPGRRGVWIGPGEVIAVESNADKLVPRVVYVTVHGRLFLCSPEQIRPISTQAEWLRQRLHQDGIKPEGVGEVRTAKGVDIRGERPSSLELEEAHDVGDKDVVVEDLKAEGEYEPLSQGPPHTPVPGTPLVPATPIPGTPTPGTPRPPVEFEGPAPSGGEVPETSQGFPTDLVEEAVTGTISPQVETPTEEPSSSLGDSVTKRGGKRPPEPNPSLEDMSQHRATAGPVQVPQTLDVPIQSQTTVRTGLEGRSRRARSRTPAREGSLWSFDDFEGEPSDHVHYTWFAQAQEHDYVGKAVGLEFDVELAELEDELSIVHIVREMCLNASVARKRNIEVREKQLTSEEREMFRHAKKSEWSQWISNDVVELIFRRGIDPKRVISSRWVLTWKPVDEDPGVKAKARLVIRGFRDPDLGQFSTASPTLSRQGRHAILCLAAHYKYRAFTLDAKTAFLAGDQTSRVKPIYAELPRDILRDNHYPEDVIAKIKKVPYGLSEAPLAWYRRLTTELLKCGFEQVQADRCVFVFREPKSPGNVLGIVGAHVDDLLVAGCSYGDNPLFEKALKELTSRLPFGDRKYADVSPVLYTGINLRQNPQTRDITIDQHHYIDKLQEVPLRKYPDGLLDKEGQGAFWSQLGALLWVAVNTRPDVAYDVSHYASYGTKPEKVHLAALNKIVRTLKAHETTITFSRVVKDWSDMTLVVFTDAGHTSRPSGHSQSGTMIFWAPKSVLQGQEVKALLADFSSSKIDRVVWSSYASELQAATLSADSAVSVLLLYEQIFYGSKAKDVKHKLTSGTQTRVLVTDNKGLYDSIQTEKPSTRQGTKMQSLVYQILYDLVVDFSFSTFWVNGEHMIADGLTKLSTSGGKTDLIRQVMATSRVRITYCTTSGRKEKQELQRLVPHKPDSRGLESSIDV